MLITLKMKGGHDVAYGEYAEVRVWVGNECEAGIVQTVSGDSMTILTTDDESDIFTPENAGKEMFVELVSPDMQFLMTYETEPAGSEETLSEEDKSNEDNEAEVMALKPLDPQT